MRALIVIVRSIERPLSESASEIGLTRCATPAEDKSPFGLKRTMIVQEHRLRAQQSALPRSAIGKIKEVTPRFCALQSRAIYAPCKVNGNHNDAKNQQRQ
jgi:hypothetical protein